MRIDGPGGMEQKPLRYDISNAEEIMYLCYILYSTNPMLIQLAL